jgi:hypothetical protein
MTDRIVQRDPALSWFPFYPSDEIENDEYLGLTLIQRGLYHDIATYCWVNGSVPNDSKKLAAMIRWPVEDVQENLCDVVDSGLIEMMAGQPGTAACAGINRVPREGNRQGQGRVGKEEAQRRHGTRRSAKRPVASPSRVRRRA